MSNKGLVLGREIKAEFGGLAFQVGQFALSLLGFIPLNTEPLIEKPPTTNNVCAEVRYLLGHNQGSRNRNT